MASDAGARAKATTPRDARPLGADEHQGAVDYLLIGHVTVDRLDERRVSLGGTATYAGLTARNMGARVAIYTSAAYEPGLVDTLFGTMIARMPAEYTTCFVNTYDETGSRRQIVESVAAQLPYEQLLPEWRNPSVVHIGPLCREVDASVVDRFPRSLVGVTPQGWMRSWGDDCQVYPTEWAEAERILRRADAVVISVDDVADRSVIAEWAAIARLLVVTEADRGCTVYSQDAPGESYHSPAFKPTREVDPTGAGDVFAGAYFWHLHQSGRNWREAADWANCVASFAVEKKGWAGVPRLEDIERRWQGGRRRS